MVIPQRGPTWGRVSEGVLEGVSECEVARSAGPGREKRWGSAPGAETVASLEAHCRKEGRSCQAEAAGSAALAHVAGKEGGGGGAPRNTGAGRIGGTWPGTEMC